MNQDGYQGEVDIGVLSETKGCLSTVSRQEGPGRNKNKSVPFFSCVGTIYRMRFTERMGQDVRPKDKGSNLEPSKTSRPVLSADSPPLYAAKNKTCYPL
jgi:hypothetical protein